MTKPRTDRLAMVAIVIAVAAVVARGTMQEGLRDPTDVLPGSKEYARGAGPKASFVLDLVCCLPALLVLLGRTLQKDSVRRKSLSCALLALLAAWTVASVAWADDKFAALISAAN